ncbi:hypothetical protein KFL_000390150 [Klebsormidium nitens]|uniref:Uncharacterized protein n=1 Tax=Klebsormidium nitens TaxID=105231 RepID=A0A1Y1HMH9_KLENI|nr:hypothetical protein KFL_000390150 [Klebsormidium nitens]|eukprot:GAQ79825.1 hypothetical protein KFL_000390150 [Klebsormidium nitens]
MVTNTLQSRALALKPSSSCFFIGFTATMAPKLTSFLYLATLLAVSAVNAADLAETLKADSQAIVTATSAAADFLKTIDESNVAEKAPLVFGLLADVHEKYNVGTIDLEPIPTPRLNPLTDEEQAEIEGNLKAIVRAQKDVSAELAAKTALFVGDGYDQPIVWVLEDTLSAVGKYAAALEPKFLGLPSKALKRQLEYLLGKAIKAYTPAPAPKAAAAI